MQQHCISGERQGGVRARLGHRSDPAVVRFGRLPSHPSNRDRGEHERLGSLGTGDKLKIANRWVYYYLDQIDQEPTGITGLFAPLGSNGQVLVATCPLPLPPSAPPPPPPPQQLTFLNLTCGAEI